MQDNNSLNIANNPESDSLQTTIKVNEKRFGNLRKFSLKNKEFDLRLIALILFLIAVGLGVFSYYAKEPSSSLLTPLKSGDSSSEKSLTKDLDVEAPLTGEYFSDSDAAEWVDERPLAVMINNHEDARPQSGLIYADVVYEIVAEGGITRFLAFFLTNTPEKIGPIRSTREYYLVLVKELGDAMLMHEGYSPQALEAINSWPVRSLQRGNASFINWRDNPRNVAVEHTLYSNGVELKKHGNETLGWEGNRDIQVWKFKDETPVTNDVDCVVGDCKPITIDFWYEGMYSAIWDYDREANLYKRSTGYDSSGDPIPHVDQDIGEQVEVKNLVVQFAVETPIVGDDKSRLEYELKGSGTGLVFRDGGVETVTWTKDSREGRTVFYTEDGEEVEFNRGKFWVSIVPARNADQVRY